MLLPGASDRTPITRQHLFRTPKLISALSKAFHKFTFSILHILANNNEFWWTFLFNNRTYIYKYDQKQSNISTPTMVSATTSTAFNSKLQNVRFDWTQNLFNNIYYISLINPLLTISKKRFCASQLLSQQNAAQVIKYSIDTEYILYYIEYICRKHGIHKHLILYLHFATRAKFGETLMKYLCYNLVADQWPLLNSSVEKFTQRWKVSKTFAEKFNFSFHYLSLDICSYTLHFCVLAARV